MSDSLRDRVAALIQELKDGEEQCTRDLIRTNEHLETIRAKRDAYGCTRFELQNMLDETEPVTSDAAASGEESERE